MSGGELVIRGSAGSRLGFAMKGGTILVDGNAGRWSAQMTLGGRIVVTGEVGDLAGESMYRGQFFVRDTAIEQRIGGNVEIAGLSKADQGFLAELFDRYEVGAAVDEFVQIIPLSSGRHSYRLFRPDVSKAGEKRAVRTAQICQQPQEAV